jgi:hypothetical protein
LRDWLIFNVLHIANHGWRILINSPSMHYKSAIALADLSPNSLLGRGRSLADLSMGRLFGHGPWALEASFEHGKAVLHEAGCKAGWISTRGVCGHGVREGRIVQKMFKIIWRFLKEKGTILLAITINKTYICEFNIGID